VVDCFSLIKQEGQGNYYYYYRHHHHHHHRKQPYHTAMKRRGVVDGPAPPRGEKKDTKEGATEMTINLYKTWFFFFRILLTSFKRTSVLPFLLPSQAHHHLPSSHPPIVVDGN